MDSDSFVLMRFPPVLLRTIHHGLREHRMGYRLKIAV